jgi:glycosyltransferase involved in cell wall biosynthesis
MESLFNEVRINLADRFVFQCVNAPFESNGLIRRLLIALHAFLNQGAVTHITGDITFAALLLARKSTIITVHDCGILKRKHGVRKWLLKKLWFEWPMNRAKFVTTVSQSAADDLISECKFDASKLVVIPNAISEKFQYSPKLFNSACPRLLHIGTAPNKNLDRLVAAIVGMSVELVIIGKLSHSAQALLAENKIVYSNQFSLTPEEIVQQYQASDIVCFTSLYEGFGLPILEGQATGRPVITSDRCSMPYVAGNAAVLVNPESTDSIRTGIRSIISDELLRAKLVRDGLENVKRFRLAAMCEKYAALYREMLSPESNVHN